MKTTNTKKEETKYVSVTDIVLQNRDDLKKQIVRKIDDSSFDSFLSSAINLVESDEKLIRCLDSEKGKKSLIDSLKIGSALSLPMNPILGLCCLVPYEFKNGEITVSYQVEKNGLVLLGKDQGVEVSSFVVYENDDLRISYSTNGDVFELTKAITKQGEPIGFLASGKKKNGQAKIKYMTIEDVVEHARRHASSASIKKIFLGIDKEKNVSSQIDNILRNDQLDWYLRQSSWLKSFLKMGEKTCIKALLMGPEFNVIIGSVLVNEDNFSNDEIIVKSESEKIVENLDKKEEKEEEKKEDII